MCFSAMCKQQYREYVRHFGATIGIEEFARLYGFKQSGIYVPTAKAMDDSFAQGDSPWEQAIRDQVSGIKAATRDKLEADLHKQRMRLSAAVLALQSKTTKKAQEDQRIATKLTGSLERRLADLDRTELKSSDSRIFQGYYVPVMIWENGQRVVKPMRYQCRPAGKPAYYDKKYEGTYNARRDNLEGFWREQFGHTHAILLASRFYENVALHDYEQRPLEPGEARQNQVVEFRPPDGRELIFACLYSHWTKPGEEDLWSFALITDEPPPEVAATGHDRCPIAIRERHIDAWLQPGGALSSYYAILDDREPLTYSHRPMS